MLFRIWSKAKLRKAGAQWQIRLLEELMGINPPSRSFKPVRLRPNGQGQKFPDAPERWGEDWEQSRQDVAVGLFL